MRKFRSKSWVYQKTRKMRKKCGASVASGVYGPKLHRKCVKKSLATSMWALRNALKMLPKSCCAPPLDPAGPPESRFKDKFGAKIIHLGKCRLSRVLH